MVKEYVHIGSTPSAEDCAQLGDENYQNNAVRECKVFIDQLRRISGNEPIGAKLKLKWQDHDFGRYVEVVCEYDVDSQEATDYAYKCEQNAPENWDEIARKELKLD